MEAARATLMSLLRNASTMLSLSRTDRETGTSSNPKDLFESILYKGQLGQSGYRTLLCTQQ
eukprot:7720231-Lingulodinium_polyedra.AAC.1